MISFRSATAFDERTSTTRATTPMLADTLTAQSRIRRIFGASASAGLAVFLASCNGEPERIVVYPASGSVKFGDEIPAGAQIQLHPLSASVPPDVVATGTVATDGTFTLGTYETNDGAAPGQYKATLHWFKVVSGDGGTGRGPNVLPKKYGDPAKSPVSITIAEGPNELPPIEIEK